MAIYPIVAEIYQSESKLWMDQRTRHGAKRLHPTTWENLNAVNNMYRTWSQNHKKCSIYCTSDANGEQAFNIRDIHIRIHYLSSFLGELSFLSVLPESSAVSVSVSPYSNSRLGDSIELWEERERKTHISTYITIWHCTQQITDVLAPHMQTDTQTYCRLYTFLFFFNTYHYSVLHTAPTHTLQARSQFRLIVCLLGVLIGCWNSRQRWLAVYIFFPLRSSYLEPLTITDAVYGHAALINVIDCLTKQIWWRNKLQWWRSEKREGAGIDPAPVFEAD